MSWQKLGGVGLNIFLRTSTDASNMQLKKKKKKEKWKEGREKEKEQRVYEYYQLMSLIRASLSSKDRRQWVKSYLSISIFRLSLKILYSSPRSLASFLNALWCCIKRRALSCSTRRSIPLQFLYSSPSSFGSFIMLLH